MKFKELLKQCDWDEIWSQLILNYENQINLHDTYNRIYNKLCIADGLPTNMRIVLKQVTEEDGDIWIDVSGKNGTTYRQSDEYKNVNWSDELMDREIVYGLDFTNWLEWLDMQIDQETLNNFMLPEIAAHCLWEMTFISFDESEVTDIMASMVEVVEGIKNGTVEVTPLDISDLETTED
jgi:hypothetical protein